MVYASLLAGGKGLRMESSIPKQYLILNDKPVFIYTLECFLNNKNIDKILLVCEKSYMDYVSSEIIKYFGSFCNVSIVEGGTTRIDSLINSINYIVSHFTVHDDDILLTHDVVRPFVSDEIIDNNIEQAKEYGAVTTVVPAIDTICQSVDGQFVNNIPIRSQMFQIQSPQTFNLKKAINVFSNLSQEEKDIITDASKPFVLNGDKVRLVSGANDNFKITNKHDLEFATQYIKSKIKTK